MIDLGATINIMHVEVMKQIGMIVDTNGVKLYSMDGRPIPIIGIMKNMEVKLVAYPQAICRVDINIIDTPPHFGMLLSRQWITLVGGNVQLDLTYATIPINGKEVKLYREPRVEKIMQQVNTS
jgi:hypothetical protein